MRSPSGKHCPRPPLLCLPPAVPARDFVSPARMIVIRSFDVNKPGTTVDHLEGGIAGGSILQGVLRRGQVVEVRPGRIYKDAQGKVTGAGTGVGAVH